MEDIYLGNPNLKKANVAQEFSEEQILEFMKCAQDPVYFAKLDSNSLTKGPIIYWEESRTE